MIFIRITLSNFQNFKIISESILSHLCPKMEYEKMEWLIWTQEAQKLLLTQKINISQVKDQESKLVQESGPNQKVEILVQSISPQWNVTF